MRWVRSLVLGTFALLPLSWAAPALANKTNAKLQLGVQTPVFSLVKLTETREVTGEDVDTSISGSQWGVRNQVTGEFGYGLGTVVVLGALFQVGGGGLTADEDGNETADSEFQMMFGPKLDIMLRSGKTVRPFFGLAGGYASAWVTNEDLNEAAAFDESSSGLRALGRLGVRFFAGKTFSFDPAFVFTYGKDKVTRELGGTGEFDVDRAGYTMGLSFGFSGWLL